MFSREQIARIIRFGIAGIAATATGIAALSVLIYAFHIWYLTASVLSFLCGFVVSFTLQKFWTFRDRDTERMGSQAALYLGIVLFNLTINTVIVYLLVEYMDLPPVVAQLAASALIACESFFVYGSLVFQKSVPKD